MASLDWPEGGVALEDTGRPFRQARETGKSIVVRLTRKGAREALDSLTAWPAPRLGDNAAADGLRTGSWQSRPLTFAHCLWVVSWPCLRWVSKSAAAGPGTHPPWTPALGLCHDLISRAFVGLDEGDEPGAEPGAAGLAQLCLLLLEANLEEHLGPLEMQGAIAAALDGLLEKGLPDASGSAYLALLSPAVMEPLIGQTLHASLQRSLLASAAGIAAPEPAERLEVGLKRELLARLAEPRLRSSKWGEEPLLLDDGEAAPTKRSRTAAAIQDALGDKTEALRLALSNKVSLQHMVKTVLDASALIQRLRSGDPAADPGERHMLSDRLHGRQALANHLIHVDAALDAHLADELLALRKADPEYFAVAVATDESPPSQRRFDGYRFQVTVLYWPRFRPAERWDLSEEAPLDVSSRMADILHCPGKDGPGVMAVIDKQLLTLGLSRYDCVNMVGDGGGENEGQARGIHAIMEAEVPGYVRRRCLGHLAWRVADAVIAEVPDYKVLKRLAEYLGEGSTWTRLQGLASLPVLEGGLGLCEELSPSHKRYFGTAPGSIVDGRPESDLRFLEFLRGREHILHLVASRDVEDRKLSEGTSAAVNLMGNHTGRAQRSVAAEMVHRALYLHRWVNVHKRIAGSMTLDELSSQAKGILQDLSLDDETVARLGCSAAVLAEKAWAPANWVELAALMEYEDEDLARDAMPALQRLHLALASRGTSHLALVVDNIYRTPWLAASVLSPKPERAQAGAAALMRHVLSVAPGKRTAFERFVADSDLLMGQLDAFAKRPVPVRVWQGGGAYTSLFKALAVRFLVAPDEVLDCERAHARWNWVCEAKRQIRLPLMNAQLRTTSYMEAHGDQLPAGEEWSRRLSEQVAAYRAAMTAALANDAIAPGFRRRCVFLERFNLRAQDVAHLMADDDGGVGPGNEGLARLRNSYQETCSVYLKKTFAARHFYQFPGLDPTVWTYVMENKTLAGREERAADEAQGRALVVCFFRQAPGAADETIVTRSDTSSTGMAAVVLSVAELALHLGYALPPDAARSSADSERMVEEALFSIARVRCRHECVPGAPDAHTYRLLDEQDAEEAFWNDHALEEHTKIDIARRLELQHGWDRKPLWNLGWPALSAACEDGVCPLPGLAAAAGPGPPRAGRGPPAARGGRRGRGRGGRGGPGGRGGRAPPPAPAPAARGRGRGPVPPLAARGRARARRAG